MFKNARCNICNKVSHGEIATNFEDYHSGSFYPDPDGHGFLCSECVEAIAEANSEFPDEEFEEDPFEYEDE